MNRIRMANLHRICLLLSLLMTILAVSVHSVLAQDGVQESFTHAATAGFTADEQNPAGQPTLTNNELRLAAGTTSPGNYIFRYNIKTTDGLHREGSRTRFTVRYRDCGNGCRLFFQIKWVNLITGDVSTLNFVDSDAFSSGHVIVTSCPIGSRFNFDFQNNAYWLELTMVKVTNADEPVFHQLKISQDNSCAVP